MTGANKILTVSYGTFSCTLEGFDEPFDTMRAIAEYFRDLAAEDRFFGAEPPVPDADTLARIAETRSQRRVEARVRDTGIDLRIRPAEPPATPAPQPQAQPQPQVIAVAARGDEPLSAEVVESVAEKLKRIRIAVAESRATPAPAPAPVATPVAATLTGLAAATAAEAALARAFDDEAEDIALPPQPELAPAAEVEAVEEPAVEAEVEAIEEPAVEAVAEVEAEAIEEPAAEDVAEVEAEAIEEPAVEAVAEDEAEAIEEPAVEAAAEVEAEAIEEPAVEAVAEVEAEAVEEPAVEAAAEVEAEAVEEPAVEAAAEVEAEAVEEPAVEAAAEVEAEAVEEPAVEAAAEVEAEAVEEALLGATTGVEAAAPVQADAEAEAIIARITALKAEVLASIAEPFPVTMIDTAAPEAEMPAAVADAPADTAEPHAGDAEPEIGLAAPGDETQADIDTDAETEQAASGFGVDWSDVEPDVTPIASAEADADLGEAADDRLGAGWIAAEDLAEIAPEPAPAEIAAMSVINGHDDAFGDADLVAVPETDWSEAPGEEISADVAAPEVEAVADADVEQEAEAELADAAEAEIAAEADVTLADADLEAAADVTAAAEAEVATEAEAETPADAEVEAEAEAEAEALPAPVLFDATPVRPMTLLQRARARFFGFGRGAAPVAATAADTTEPHATETAGEAIDAGDDAPLPVLVLGPEQAAAPETEGEEETGIADAATLRIEAEAALAIAATEARAIARSAPPAEPEAEPAEDRAAPPATALARRAEDADVERIIAKTDTEMSGPESRRRQSAISHLKAAVAATEAERDGRPGATTLPPMSDAQFREDLSQAIRPRRPVITGEAGRARPEGFETRPDPLVLGVAQRIDRTRPDLAVQPRRVSTRNLLRDDFDPEEEEYDDTTPTTGEALEASRNFAEFAERMGANNLPELLEAAAAYTSAIEGHAYFSRPQILQKVARIADDGDFSREESLRSFGMLLRQGKIQKIRRGQFVIASTSKFMAEARRAQM